jgi:hypothetical protein
MKKREAIRILMLSPIYWRHTPAQRVILIAEFCKNINEASIKIQK